MNTDNRYIIDRLKEQKEYAQEELMLDDEDILGIFALGSMNYGLYTKDSDVDSLLITIPSLDEMCFKKPLSKELKYDNNEKIKVKDIREYRRILLKQNEADLQTLFTDFYILNEKYEKYFQDYFIRPREEICRINPHRAIKSLKAQSFHILDKLSSQLPCFEKEGKRLAKVRRFYHLLKNYCKGKEYYKCLMIDDSNEIAFLRKLKSGEINLSVAARWNMADNLFVKIRCLENYSKDERNDLVDLESLMPGVVTLVQARNEMYFTNEEIKFDF